jgi:hypothetical protein
MEPLVELYLELASTSQEYAIFVNDAQDPFRPAHVVLTRQQYDELGGPRVLYVQASAFLGERSGPTEEAVLSDPLIMAGVADAEAGRVVRRSRPVVTG